ncbi:ionotropic receptor 93a-like [Macrobrachium rosenbergii]|uniref:ionotropic receptor 93a-like n=1 Tax=Macrobrachium rosenbergii TaxID=79674 RepID=UPI0034D62DEF
MNGKMQRREGHFGLGYSFLTNNDNRMAAIDFTQFYDCDQSCFMARTEPPIPKWQSLLAPFKLDTWMGTLIGLLVISPIIYFLANGPATDVEEVKSLKLLQISYLFTLGYHLREPQVQIPKRTATKVWILFLSIHTLVLTTLYCGNLTAFLTIERRQPSIETIQELHESGRSVIGIGCYFKVSFEESSNVYIKVGDALLKGTLVVEVLGFSMFIA